VLGQDRVLGGYHDASGFIHEQRSKRVISILSCADCELDGLPDEFLMGWIHARIVSFWQLR
jgi:hypothetical protein